jgi:hypothetical protein
VSGVEQSVMAGESTPAYSNFGDLRNRVMGSKEVCLQECGVCYNKIPTSDGKTVSYNPDMCMDRYGQSDECEKCCDTGQEFDEDSQQCKCPTGETFNEEQKKCIESFQGKNVIKENFENLRIPLNVAFVESPTSSCPWGKNNSIIKPFSINENYATV